MNLSVLWQAGIAIQLHAIAATIAIILGALVLFGKKGNKHHKFLGRIWSVIMVLVIISSAFISELRLWGPFSPIHILTLLGGWSLGQGIYFIRKGNVNAHQAAMKNLYFWGLGVAGTLAFSPGRVMNLIIFPNSPDMGFYFILAIFLLVMGIRSNMAKGFVARMQANFNRS